MLKNQKGSYVVGLFITLFYLFMLIAWGSNIVKFCSSDFQEPYKNEIIRGIGIPCFPVGVICGFMTIDDTKKDTK